jgi:hypothetical protein
VAALSTLPDTDYLFLRRVAGPRAPRKALDFRYLVVWVNVNQKILKRDCWKSHGRKSGKGFKRNPEPLRAVVRVTELGFLSGPGRGGSAT